MSCFLLPDYGTVVDRSGGSCAQSPRHLRICNEDATLLMRIPHCCLHLRKTVQRMSKVYGFSAIKWELHQINEVSTLDVVSFYVFFKVNSFQVKMFVKKNIKSEWISGWDLYKNHQVDDCVLFLGVSSFRMTTSKRLLGP